MKQLFAMLAALALMASPMLAQAVDLDDITMQTMDVKDDAADVTNDIELPDFDDDRNDDRHDTDKNDNRHDDKDDDHHDEKDDDKDEHNDDKAGDDKDGHADDRDHD